MIARAAAAAGIVAAAASLPTAPAAAAPVTYRLVPERSWVTAEVLHFGTSTIRARFGPIDGRVVLDPAAGTGELGIEIETARVDTGFKPFDARLRQDDLLASTAHPKAWFVAGRFRYDGDRLVEVRGEFTLRGIGRPLSLTALRYGCRDEGAERICGGDFEGMLRRSEFGAAFGAPLVGDIVRLVVAVEGRAPR